MHAFDVLGDPVRRRIIEALANDSLASGEIVDIISADFGITQSAVSQHLKVLRDHGFATVAIDGARRVYTLRAAPLAEIDQWIAQFRDQWDPRLDALATEIARSRR